ncbi:MAG: hypothetical protein EOO27_01015 [Comamonadaceae bacterium]|nr:MAG: hypothetical protein EOO27_01015 [Comamonadaceae bacterium]
MADKHEPFFRTEASFRDAGKSTLQMVLRLVNAKHREQPEAFAFQLSEEGIRAAEHHLHHLWQIFDRHALAPSVTPESLAADDRAFQEFLALQGLKEASHD